VLLSLERREAPLTFFINHQIAYFGYLLHSLELVYEKVTHRDFYPSGIANANKKTELKSRFLLSFANFRLKTEGKKVTHHRFH
jgi:hypothetical protein